MSAPPFDGTLPAALLYDTAHDMWVRHTGDEVVIGATSFGIHLAGEIIAFTAKPRGAEVLRGRGLGTVESAKTVIAIHAPLSFLLEAANQTAEEHPRLINDNPYGAGWLVCGRPLAWDAESRYLVDAAAYADHVRAMEPGALVEITP